MKGISYITSVELPSAPELALHHELHGEGTGSEPDCCGSPSTASDRTRLLTQLVMPPNNRV